MNSRACDYFFSELRKEVDDIRTEHELEKSVGYFLNKDKLNIVEKVVDRQIFEKHKESIRYFFNCINNYSDEIRMTDVNLQQKTEMLKNLVEEMIKNKKILKRFPLFEDSFINMVMRFSQNETWGYKTSLDYLVSYFRRN
tara:strand:+ start:700 stop:1119 length:420 start_codon:yes stop_codon:yes gene_type:complete